MLPISDLCNPTPEEETGAPSSSTVAQDAQAPSAAPPEEQYPTPESPVVAQSPIKQYTPKALSPSDTEPNERSFVEHVEAPLPHPHHHPGWTAVNLRLPPILTLGPCICTGSYGSPYCPRVIGNSYKPTPEKEPALDEDHDSTVQDDTCISRLPPAVRRSLECDEPLPKIAQHPDKITKKQQQKAVKRRQVKKRPHNDLEKVLFPSLDKTVGMRANSPEPGLTQLDYSVLSRITS